MQEAARSKSQSCECGIKTKEKRKKTRKGGSYGEEERYVSHHVVRERGTGETGQSTRTHYSEGGSEFVPALTGISSLRRKKRVTRPQKKKSFFQTSSLKCKATLNKARGRGRRRGPKVRARSTGKGPW